MRSWVAQGAVFRWPHDDRPARVLMCDDDVVMYDSWWPHLGTWGLADLTEVRRQHINYYSTFTSALLEKATHLRSEPLTDNELAIHRPDLPFGIGRCEGLAWPAVAKAATAAEAAELLRAAGCVTAGADPALPVAAVYLCPFGPKGGHKPAVRVTADDGNGFGQAELIWKAATLQARHAGDEIPTEGVGIYRTGLQRGLATYNLWGYESRLHTNYAAWLQRSAPT
jgi:hypothetical protein